MGITVGMYAVGDANIERLLTDARVFYRIVAPDDPEAWNRHQGGVPWWKKLLGGKSAEPATPEVTLAPGEGEIGDLDKAWHGLHYLYTGSANGGTPPLDFISAGGRTVPDTDNGLGCARVFSASETAAIYDALRGLSKTDLRARFNPDEMIELRIYPDIWDRDPADQDTLGYLLECHSWLMRFLDHTVGHRLGMIVETS